MIKANRHTNFVLNNIRNTVPQLSPLMGLLISFGACAGNTADPIGPSQSDFGGVGLMQMPTARMAKEGELSLNLMDNDPYRRYSISLQVLPWLETTVRYTDTTTRLYGAADFSGDQTHKDKGVDVKFRLLKENYYQPELSLGFRDVAGTGLFDGEFVVANKQFGPLDFSLGLGWGYLAKGSNITNPFCRVKDSFCSRVGGYGGSTGGQTNFKRFFHGESSIFGGLEYQTPWPSLRLKFEYDGNDYRNEFAGTIAQRSPINVGAVYRVADFIDAQLSYQRGNTLMFGLIFRNNLNSLRPMSNPASEIYQPSPATNLVDAPWEKMAEQLNHSAGWENAEIHADEQSLTVVAEQTKYRNPNEAIDRAAIILANSAPASIQQFNLIETKQGMPLEKTVIDRNQLALQHQEPVLGVANVVAEPITIEPVMPLENIVRPAKDNWINYYVNPLLVQSIGGPEAFYMYQVGLNGVVEAKFAQHYLLSGMLYLNLADNYDQFNYTEQPPDGNYLPPVRTLIRKYVNERPVRINNLQLTRFDQLADGWYSQLYGGYLEMMFAGVGGEVMYRPLNTNWALGFDLNWVRQRDWENQFGLLDYSVTTGNLSAYTKLPYVDNVWAKLSVGRYLAKDIGGTIDVSKEFDSGIRAGFFATKTNVSAEQYGEGGFTKGFYLSIPFDLFSVRSSRQKASISWVALTRDGGQPLGRKFNLHSLTESRGEVDSIFK